MIEFDFKKYGVLHMEYIYILIGALIISIVIAVAAVGQSLKAEQGNASDDPLPDEIFSSNEKLLSAYEETFAEKLIEALPEGYSALCKVRVSDLISVNRKVGKSAYQTNFNKLCMKHVDFVVTLGISEIAFAIELDDSSHKRADRIERDRFINEAFRGAGIPLIRVAENIRKMSAEQLRDKLPLPKREVTKVEKLGSTE